MKIASWNVNSLNARWSHLERWLIDFQPDLVALQEIKMETKAFPAEAVRALGFEAVVSGQKAYNGVALLARATPSDVVTDIPGFIDDQRRVLAATIGELRVINLYVVNGQEVGSDKYRYKLEWLASVKEWLRAELATHPNLIVLGDFNIAPDDRDVHDPAAWHERILCSTPEREALRQIQALGLHDGLRLISDAPGQYSWWDYRRAAFRRNLGLRIDLILVSDSLRSSVTAAGIDRTPRTWERPSDHAPVWLQLD